MALGNFDGVHLGHQRLIKGVVESAERSQSHSVVVTFDPHPMQFFAKASDFMKIDHRTIRRKLLTGLGVEALLELKFDESFSLLSAEQFLNLLSSAGHLKQISVGPDFRFGSKRSGDVQFLRNFCEIRGIEAVIVEPVYVGKFVASSSQIRNWLRQGDVESAASMLGRNYSMIGRVIHGQKLGRTIGFPTANLACQEQLIPGQGVYAGRLKVLSDLSSELRSEDFLSCVINIGRRPTVSDVSSDLSVEAHVFDHLGDDFDLYDQMVEIRFDCRLRDEKKFQDVLELQRQIEVDIKNAKQKLKDSVGL